MQRRINRGGITGRVVSCDIAVSADGFSAGHHQTKERPFGDGETNLLHAWMFDTPDENKTKVEQFTNAKAFVMARNMFGPIRGDWHRDWKRWWGRPPWRAGAAAVTCADNGLRSRGAPVNDGRSVMC
jgi:hypothetical protein